MADDDKLSKLLDFVRVERKVCPQPKEWSTLWEMLPDKERVGNGWEPGLPLILGAWWYTSPLEKMIRLREHIEYAAHHGVLDQVDTFLRGLLPEQWHTLDQK